LKELNSELTQLSLRMIATDPFPYLYSVGRVFIVQSFGYKPVAFTSSRSAKLNIERRRDLLGWASRQQVDKLLPSTPALFTEPVPDTESVLDRFFVGWTA